MWNKVKQQKTPSIPSPAKIKLIEKRAQICASQKLGGSELEEGGHKVETSSFKINTRDVMYSVMTG